MALAPVKWSVEAAIVCSANHPGRPKQACRQGQARSSRRARWLPAGLPAPSWLDGSLAGVSLLHVPLRALSDAAA